MKSTLFSFIAAALVLSGTAFAGDGTSVSGFVDAELHVHKDRTATQGFSIHDGAVYLNHAMGDTSAVVDVPFASVGTDTSAALVLGAAKAQGYVAHKYSNGVSWKLGQWDTPLGMEAIDTVDIAFTRSGLIRAYLPTVHAGLMFGWANDQIGLNAFAAERHDSTMWGTHRLDIGLTGTFKHDMFHAKAGFVMLKDDGNENSGNILDLVAGVENSGLTVDGEFMMRKNPVAGAEGYSMFGGQVKYAMDAWTFGARFEYSPKMVNGTLLALTTYTGVENGKSWKLTLGPQYQMTKNLNVRFDFTNDSDTVTGATATNNHYWVLAAVYKM